MHLVSSPHEELIVKFIAVRFILTAVLRKSNFNEVFLKGIYCLPLPPFLPKPSTLPLNVFSFAQNSSIHSLYLCLECFSFLRDSMWHFGP